MQKQLANYIPTNSIFTKCTWKCLIGCGAPFKAPGGSHSRPGIYKDETPLYFWNVFGLKIPKNIPKHSLRIPIYRTFNSGTGPLVSRPCDKVVCVTE